MSKAISIITPPAALPVDADALKVHLRIEGDDGSHDALLNQLSGAATSMFERETRTAIITRTLRLNLDKFTAAIFLPFPPCGSVVSITYLDADGQQQTLDPSLYQVDTAHVPARIIPAVGESWPIIRQMLGAVSINYTAGHAADAVPDDITACIKLIAGHLYDNPTATTSLSLNETPMAARAIIDLHRMPDLG